MSNPVIDFDGSKRWYNKAGQYHREDGPAVEYASGDNFWCINGKLHREDGPAVEYINGDKEWWYQGKEINCQSQEEFERIIRLLHFT